MCTGSQCGVMEKVQEPDGGAGHTTVSMSLMPPHGMLKYG